MTALGMQSVLVVAAHPDDEVLGCGGTIAKLTAGGARVNVALLADGVGSRDEAGLASPPAGPDLEERRAAARLANQLLGVSAVEFGDFLDNQMDHVPRLDVIKFIERLVTRYKPDTILTHHAGDVNVDHRCVHDAVVAATRPQPGHVVRSLLFFEIASSTEWQPPGSAPAFTPNYFVEIGDQLAIRERALQAYGVEMRPFPHPRSYEAVNYLARWRGATCGVAAAEAFMLGRHIDRR